MSTAARRLGPYDRELLALLRGSFPLDRRPFAVLGGTLGADEDELIADVRRLAADRHFDRIAPVFAAKAFGLHPTLVAARVPPEALWIAERAIAQHPGVSHLRIADDASTCWFTLAVDPESVLGLTGTLRVLGHLTRADSIRPLAVRRVFAARRPADWRDELLGLAGEQRFDPQARAGAAERAVAQTTQEGLDIDVEPFAGPADRLGLTQDELLSRLSAMRATGMAIRVGAIGGERRAVGERLHAAWVLPDPGGAEDVLRSDPAVAFAVERQTHADWPFNLHLTIVGDDRHDGERSLAALERRAAPTAAKVIDTIRSSKLRRRLFASEEHRAWEEIHARSLTTS